MKIYKLAKQNKDYSDIAVFLEDELTQSRQDRYESHGYEISEYETAEDFVANLEPDDHYGSMTDGEALDLLVTLLDNGFVEWTVNNE